MCVVTVRGFRVLSRVTSLSIFHALTCGRCNSNGCVACRQLARGYDVRLSWGRHPGVRFVGLRRSRLRLAGRAPTLSHVTVSHVGDLVGGIASFEVRHAADTPWRGF